MTATQSDAGVPAINTTTGLPVSAKRPRSVIPAVEPMTLVLIWPRGATRLPIVGWQIGKNEWGELRPWPIVPGAPEAEDIDTRGIIELPDKSCVRANGGRRFKDLAEAAAHVREVMGDTPRPSPRPPGDQPGGTHD
jgi:hypothetical protein